MITTLFGDMMFGPTAPGHGSVQIIDGASDVLVAPDATPLGLELHPATSAAHARMITYDFMGPSPSPDY
jgi:hypothetical protein